MNRFNILILGMFLLAGCAGLQRGTEALRAESLRFTPTEDKANVYIFRSNGFVGCGVQWKFLFQTEEVEYETRLGCGTYAFLRLPPGPYQVSGFASNGEKILELFDFDAGKNYFLEHVRYLNGVTLSAVEEKKGKQIIPKDVLVESIQTGGQSDDMEVE